MKSKALSAKRRGRLGNFGLLVGSLIVSLIGAELILRGMIAQPDDQPLVTEHDPLLGWHLIPGASGTARSSEYEAPYRINSLGLRGEDIAPKNPEERRILLLGDSFVEGWGVDRPSMVGTVLSRALGTDVSVVNGGTRGWSTDQELLFYREFVDAIDPDVTVLFFYINDVCANANQRYWRGSKPKFDLLDGKLRLTGVPVAKPAPPEAQLSQNILGRIRTALESTALYRVTAKALGGLAKDIPPPAPAWAPWDKTGAALDCIDPGWEVTEALLTELRDDAEARGNEFLVFWIPTREATYPDAWAQHASAYELDDEAWSPLTDAEKLGDICERQGLECLIPVDRFRQRAETSAERLYYREDPHWTPAGHEFAARLLLEALRERPAAPDPTAGSVGP